MSLLAAALLWSALAPAQTGSAVPVVTPLAQPQAVPLSPLVQQPVAAAEAAPAAAASAARRAPTVAVAAEPALPPAEPTEFEAVVRDANGGKPVARLGALLRRQPAAVASTLETPVRVPPSYLLQVGDEVAVTVWGSVEGQWLLRVDRSGRLTLPRVGPVAVAGARAGELEALLRSRLERVFKGFELSAAVSTLTPVAVHITGFVERPGDYLLPALSTVWHALAQAEGPAAGGSWRRIHLLRDGQLLARLDLYDLLREGRLRGETLLQTGDVLHVQASGPQVALLGSVHRPAIIEFLPGETLADALALAGGFNPVADRQTLLLERLAERTRAGTAALTLSTDQKLALNDGDLLRVRSQMAAAVGGQLRNKRVVVAGEVRNPGEYLLPPGATLADALQAAGGSTERAYLYGAVLKRDSVRTQQEQNYERALRELELGLARSASSRSDRNEYAAEAEASIRQTLARLRSVRPEGRMLLDVSPTATALPELPLEDGDHLHLPAANQSVGVYGSVYNTGSFVHSGGKVGDYLKRAGGPTNGADYGATFLIRANGTVQALAQQGGWWTREDRFEALPTMPGDTIFVPEDIFRGSWIQAAKDWTQILYNLGVGLAALRTIE